MSGRPVTLCLRCRQITQSSFKSPWKCSRAGHPPHGGCCPCSLQTKASQYVRETDMSAGQSIWRLILVASLAFASEANAGLVYNWVQESAPESMPYIGTGRIELDPSYWPNGTIELSETCFSSLPPPASPCGGKPPTQLLDFHFGLNKDSSVDLGGRIFVIGFGNFDINGASPLRGSFYFADDDANLSMSSLEGSTLWRISLYASDAGPRECFFSPRCSGATGRWVLDLSSVPVPEPSSAALLGFGLLPLSAFIRRRRK